VMVMLVISFSRVWGAEALPLWLITRWSPFSWLFVSTPMLSLSLRSGSPGLCYAMTPVRTPVSVSLDQGL
jgi:hypothetical protein